jgi:hypothetical protein
MKEEDFDLLDESVDIDITPSEEEWKMAETAAHEIEEKIHQHWEEYVCPDWIDGVKNHEHFANVEVIIPMTENINMTFRFQVPYPMMDADHDTLLKYFREKVYPYNGNLFTESVEYKTQVGLV